MNKTQKDLLSFTEFIFKLASFLTVVATFKVLANVSEGLILKIIYHVMLVLVVFYSTTYLTTLVSEAFDLLLGSKKSIFFKVSAGCVIFCISATASFLLIKAIDTSIKNLPKALSIS